jgi:hypothetical protein
MQRGLPRTFCLFYRTRTTEQEQHSHSSPWAQGLRKAYPTFDLLKLTLPAGTSERVHVQHSEKK